MNDVIIVKQLPVIDEHLRLLKNKWEQRVTDAQAMVCTADTIQAVKAFRTEMRKEFDDIEALRKAAKRAVMEPYTQFEAVYKDTITYPYQKADKALSGKVMEVENEIKRRCEDGLRDYFDELCDVYHLDWLTYERVGINVDMVSAKAKTPKKLREQLEAFVKDVKENVSVISGMDNAEEILVEYQRCLNFADAYDVVQHRHRCIEAQKAAQEARNAEQKRASEMVRRVEALAPPVQAEHPKIVKCTFTVYTTMDKLKKLKEFCNMEGIQYE